MRLFKIIILLLLSVPALSQVENKIPQYVFNGKLGVGRTGNNDTTAYFHVGTTQSTKGVMLSRVADTASVAGNKPNGLLIFSVQLNNYAFWDSIAGIWSDLGGGSDFTAGYGLTLSSGTLKVDTTHYTGVATQLWVKYMLDSVSTSTATIDNHPDASGFSLLDMSEESYVYAKKLIGAGGIELDSTTTPGAIIIDCDGCGGGGDTANLIFDTIPNGTSLSTVVFQSGDTLRTRGIKDSTGVTVGINGRGDLYIMLAGGGADWTHSVANTLSTDGILGTASNHDVHLYTNNVKRAEFTNTGDFFWNATSASTANNKVYFNDTTEIKALRILPAGSALTGGGSNAFFGYKGTDASSTTYALYFTDHLNTSILRISNAGDITGKPGTWQSNLFTLTNATGSFRATNVGATTGNIVSIGHSNASTFTSGNANIVRTTGNFTASSGTGTMSSLSAEPIWAATSTFSGTLTGIKINPSITSLASGESRFLEITSNTTDWPIWYMNQNRITTTDATVTTLISVKTSGTGVSVNNPDTYLIECDIIGNRTGGSSGTNGDIGVYHYKGVFTRVNGTVTMETETLTVIKEDQAGWTITSNINSTVIELQVTGAADNNITWGTGNLKVSRLGN